MLLAAVFVLFFLALCGSVVYGVFILYPLLLGLLSVGFVAWSRGYAIGTILRMGYTGAKQSLIVVEVFFHIGALTAAWRAAGTIGFLVHHGLQMLSPGAFLVGCFLLPLAFSVLLGTAIGTVGVIGIALMVIAKAGGMDPALAAGAIVAGAYFGDRCSPMSSSAHLVASITRTDVYVNLKNMAKSSALPLLLALAGYAWLSLLHPLDATEEQFSARIAAAPDHGPPRSAGPCGRPATHPHQERHAVQHADGHRHRPERTGHARHRYAQSPCRRL